MELRLGRSGADAAELDELTRALRDELDQLDGVETAVAEESSVAHAKGIGLGAIGAFLLQLVQAGAFSQVAGVLTGWLSRDKDRTLTLQDGERKIEVHGISKKDQQAALTAWLEAGHKQAGNG